MSKCTACRETITRERVKCYGICDGQFHAKCANLNTAAIKALNEFDTIKYVCNNCDLNSSKVVLKKINQLIDNINNENIESNNNVITKIADDVNHIKNVVKKNEGDLKEMKLKSRNDNKEKNSYADVVKSNEPVVLVVPKGDQNNKTTRDAIKEKIDPTKVPIENLRNASKGTVVMEGKTKEDVKRIKECVEKEMGEQYDVKMTELIKPKIIISGMDEQFTNEKLINNLRKQNDILKDIEEIEVLFSYSYKDSYKNVKYSAVIKIDGENFKNIVDSKVNIGWNKCFVREYLSVRRCYNCLGYYHNAKDCTKKKSCKKCAGDHDIKDCKSEIIKCVNCINANDKLKLNLDIYHKASSKECNVFLRKLSIERRKINYSI